MRTGKPAAGTREEILRRIARTVIKAGLQNPHILQSSQRFQNSTLVRFHQMGAAENRVYWLSEAFPHTLNHI